LRVTDLRALRDKYEQMLRLRQLHARAKAEPDFVEPDPRSAMAALARLYPGALREVDELPIELITTRIEELVVADADPERIVAWMRAQSAFHSLARGALAVKRWLAGRPPTRAMEEAFAEKLRAMPEHEREELREWQHDLAAIAAPPGGRLMGLVYEKLARELAIDADAARAAVFPLSRSLRGRRARPTRA
jgi:hypothetical protein